MPIFFSFLVQESKILYWLTVGERGTLSERTTDDDERQTRVERRMYLYYAYTHVDSIILLSLTSCLSLYLYLDRLDSIRGYEPNYNYYSCSLTSTRPSNKRSFATRFDTLLRSRSKKGGLELKSSENGQTSHDAIGYAIDVPRARRTASGTDRYAKINQS